MDLSCVICSETYNQVSDVRVTKCGHVFHYDCITSWLERSITCPQCRNSIQAFGLHRIFLNFENESDLHSSRDCDADDLRMEVQNLQTENESMQIEMQKMSEDLEELQVINLSLHDLKLDSSRENNTRLQSVLSQNVSLQRELEECKNELAEIRLKNLKLTEEILPNAKHIIEELQESLKILNMIEENHSPTNDQRQYRGIEENQNGQTANGNQNPSFKKQLNLVKKSTFDCKTNDTTNLFFGIDRSDREAVVENLIKHMQIDGDNTR